MFAKKFYEPRGYCVAGVPPGGAIVPFSGVKFAGEKVKVVPADYHPAEDQVSALSSSRDAVNHKR